MPLVSPTSTDERIAYLSSNAGSFLYCVSVTGVTGARGALPADLKAFVDRVRTHSTVPLAVGFGISTPEHVKEVSEVAEGIVVGSAIISNIDSSLEKSPADRAKALETFVSSMTAAIAQRGPNAGNTKCSTAAPVFKDVSNRNFGDFGGRYIPETLIEAHRELEVAYAAALADPAFHEEVAFYRREFIGGPTPLYFAKNLSKKIGGANIWFKREELAHTGAHKVGGARPRAMQAAHLLSPWLSFFGLLPCPCIYFLSCPVGAHTHTDTCTRNAESLISLLLFGAFLPIPLPTARSITRSGKRCWRSVSARTASSLRRARASTGSPRPPCAHTLASTAPSTWAPSTANARNSTCFA